MTCPKCSWTPMDESRDGMVNRFECPKCGKIEVFIAMNVRPGPPGGWPEDLRFGSNHSQARTKEKV